MEANKVQAITAPGYSTAEWRVPAGSCDQPGGAICTPAQAAQFDLVGWQAAVGAILPQG